MNTLLAAGLLLVALLTLLGIRVFAGSRIDKSTKVYLIVVNIFTITIEVLSALALLGTIG